MWSMFSFCEYPVLQAVNKKCFEDLASMTQTLGLLENKVENLQALLLLSFLVNILFFLIFAVIIGAVVYRTKKRNPNFQKQQHSSQKKEQQQQQEQQHDEENPQQQQQQRQQQNQQPHQKQQKPQHVQQQQLQQQLEQKQHQLEQEQKQQHQLEQELKQQKQLEQELKQQQLEQELKQQKQVEQLSKQVEQLKEQPTHSIFSKFFQLDDQDPKDVHNLTFFVCFHDANWDYGSLWFCLRFLSNYTSSITYLEENFPKNRYLEHALALFMFAVDLQDWATLMNSDLFNELLAKALDEADYGNFNFQLFSTIARKYKKEFAPLMDLLYEKLQENNLEFKEIYEDLMQEELKMSRVLALSATLCGQDCSGLAQSLMDLPEMLGQPHLKDVLKQHL